MLNCLYFKNSSLTIKNIKDIKTTYCIDIHLYMYK